MATPRGPTGHVINDSVVACPAAASLAALTLKLVAKVVPQLYSPIAGLSHRLPQRNRVPSSGGNSPFQFERHSTGGNEAILLARDR